ncbi:uncharacterized protein FFM5_15349 [Fusarium fujikuroi]|nr:uncharacterized protein FFM5_15349 [Fusarium fujikuroi]
MSALSDKEPHFPIEKVM